MKALRLQSQWPYGRYADLRDAKTNCDSHRSRGRASVILRKTVDNSRGIYRIFEAARDVFHVLDENGRTVDQFDIAHSRNEAGIAVHKALRRKPLMRGVPDLARRFAAELNPNRRRG
jgi:hypothetical protein